MKKTLKKLPEISEIRLLISECLKKDYSYSDLSKISDVQLTTLIRISRGEFIDSKYNNVKKIYEKLSDLK